MTQDLTAREREIERAGSWLMRRTRPRPARLAHRARPRGQAQADLRAHIDTGDHVIVLNAARIAVTRDKRESKVYAATAAIPQGFKQETLGHLLARRPEEVIRRAVKGMLPRNRLGPSNCAS